jgi:hypothetical protein
MKAGSQWMAALYFEVVGPHALQKIIDKTSIMVLLKSFHVPVSDHRHRDHY